MDLTKTYYKIMTLNEKHHHFQYHEGLNVLPESETFADADADHCAPGGFYFTIAARLPEFKSIGPWIREITLPHDNPNLKVVEILTSKGEPWKYRANMIILGKRYTIADPKIMLLQMPFYLHFSLHDCLASANTYENITCLKYLIPMLRYSLCPLVASNCIVSEVARIWQIAAIHDDMEMLDLLCANPSLPAIGQYYRLELIDGALESKGVFLNKLIEKGLISQTDLKYAVARTFSVGNEGKLKWFDEQHFLLDLVDIVNAASERETHLQWFAEEWSFAIPKLMYMIDTYGSRFHPLPWIDALLARISKFSPSFKENCAGLEQVETECKAIQAVHLN